MDSNEPDKKVVGAQIPDHLSNVIDLYSIVSGEYKSQIIRDAILLWMDENNIDLQTVAKKLRSKYKAEWLRIKNNKKEQDDPTPLTKGGFENQKRKELSESGFPPHVIAEIFKKF